MHNGIDQLGMVAVAAFLAGIKRPDGISADAVWLGLRWGDVGSPAIFLNWSEEQGYMVGKDGGRSRQFEELPGAFEYLKELLANA